jgi:rhodanese-related sulfurtransferase
MKKMKLLLVAVVGLLLLHACSHPSKSIQPNNTAVVNEIDQTAFVALLKNKQPIIIDVRTPAEVAEGIIPGATLFIDVKDDQFQTRIAQLDTTKTYVLYCRSGARSNTAGNIMLDKGFKLIYNLSGGVLNWKGAIIKP